MCNIVLITTGKRPQLFAQSLNSLITNAADWSKHTLTVVIDSDGPPNYDVIVGAPYITTIINTLPRGASRSRNIGAASIPKYLRQSHVMFIDDDVFLTKNWDGALERASNYFTDAVITGHCHPFNHTVLRESEDYLVTDVISTVHMLMPWSLWENAGWFIEPGGPGASEDVDYCRRVTAKGYPLVITKKHCVIHCGLTSSRGQPIIGAESVAEQNRTLIERYGLNGKVVMI